jgi:hypothetical protein
MMAFTSAILTSSLFSGCIAAGIGLAAAALSDDSDEKKAFQENNTIREKEGLKPLTWGQWENCNDKEKLEAKKKESEKAIQSEKSKD